MVFYVATSQKKCVNPEEFTDVSSSNIEKLINYAVDVFPPSAVIKLVSDRNDRLDSIREGNLEIKSFCVNNVFNENPTYNCSFSLFVLLKCLVNC
jgi:hypothetical protein